MENSCVFFGRAAVWRVAACPASTVVRVLTCSELSPIFFFISGSVFHDRRALPERVFSLFFVSDCCLHEEVAIAPFLESGVLLNGKFPRENLVYLRFFLFLYFIFLLTIRGSCLF